MLVLAYGDSSHVSGKHHTGPRKYALPLLTYYCNQSANVLDVMMVLYEPLSYCFGVNS